MLESSASRKMVRFALKTLSESVGAAYVSCVLAYSAALGIVLFTGDHRWIDAILISPTFLLPIIAGAFFAYVLRNHLSRTSYFAWIVPGAILCGAVLEVVKSPGAISSAMWDTLLGTKCRASECLYEALFTVPLVCALSYSVSSVCIRAAKRSSISTGENTSK
jgi:hypothetical protein